MIRDYTELLTEIRQTQSMVGSTFMKTGLTVLITVCGVGAVLKETSHFDAEGRIIRTVTEDLPETEKCWQYTWLGMETDKTNVTGSCRDLDTDDGEQEPCFAPIVWTVADEYGENQPDEEELEEECSMIGCTPFCTPGPGQKCMKYVKKSGGRIAYMSKFCGEVVDWDGGSPSHDRCHNKGNTWYCYCRGYKCNRGTSYHNMSYILAIVLLVSVRYL